MVNEVASGMVSLDGQSYGYRLNECLLREISVEDREELLKESKAEV
jgi:hypothetical protein